MKGAVRLLSAAFALTGILTGSAVLLAADGVLLREPAAVGNYCHLKFPAIEEETLNWDRPVLKPSNTRDIIDFYGPCDHDPLGLDEIQSQKRQLSSERRDEG